MFISSLAHMGEIMVGVTHVNVKIGEIMKPYTSSILL
jgi:hypothetical protein